MTRSGITHSTIANETSFDLWDIQVFYNLDRM